MAAVQLDQLFAPARTARRGPTQSKALVFQFLDGFPDRRGRRLEHGLTVEFPFHRGGRVEHDLHPADRRRRIGEEVIEDAAQRPDQGEHGGNQGDDGCSAFKGGVLVKMTAGFLAWTHPGCLP